MRAACGIAKQVQNKFLQLEMRIHIKAHPSHTMKTNTIDMFHGHNLYGSNEKKWLQNNSYLKGSDLKDLANKKRLSNHNLDFNYYKTLIVLSL